MNKTFPTSYILLSLELTLDFIVLDYSLLDTTCFTYAEDNFIRVTCLFDRRLTALNITGKLNQCHERNVSTSIARKKKDDPGLYGRIIVKKSLLRK